MKAKLIRSIASICSMAAIVFATSACIGKFHEPKMPEKLQ